MLHLALPDDATATPALAPATSQANGADYSADAHTALLERLGGGPDVGLLNLAHRAALATGITGADDLA